MKDTDNPTSTHHTQPSPFLCARAHHRIIAQCTITHTCTHNTHSALSTTAHCLYALLERGQHRVDVLDALLHLIVRGVAVGESATGSCARALLEALEPCGVVCNMQRVYVYVYGEWCVMHRYECIDAVHENMECKLLPHYHHCRHHQKSPQIQTHSHTHSLTWALLCRCKICAVGYTVSESNEIGRRFHNVPRKDIKHEPK